ncbi:MAG: TIGR03663 family protein [Pyrinomonadaceae bacterium MAG19_C2-C3]|nr:TIGR03663 family protein [Pyrinomonadaceae bacterium MAG19_C2-C3]
MTTASTKSNRKSANRHKAQRERPSNGTRNQPRSEVNMRDEELTARFVMPEAWWRWACLAVLIIAAAFRFYALDLKPMHHDEGVNGFFLTNLIRLGTYRYDPANYHGPTLYYLALPFTNIIGLNEYAVRGLTAVAGLGSVALLFALRRRIGDFGALAAALLLAVSPGAIYYSRYFIHESLFVFFTIAIVVCALRYYDDRRVGDLFGVAVAAALLFATKETAFISVGVLMIAVALAHFYTGGKSRGRLTGNFANRWRDKQDGALYIIMLGAGAVLIFAIINVLLYSSFFTNPQGITDAVSTFKIWTRTGTSDFHRYPFWTYLKWFAQEEAALMTLAGVGVCFALWSNRNRFAMFAALWAGGIVAAYSLIPYKTPWLALNFLPAFAIIAGYGLERLMVSGHARFASHVPALALLLIAALIGAYQSYILNFKAYDDDRYPYVYAHTRRDVLRLIADIERLAAENRAAKSSANSTADDIYRDTVTSISIAAPEYWSLPWYFREYKLIQYPPRSPAAATEQLLITSADQKREAGALLNDSYQEYGTYTLRPGVELVLYRRRTP